MYYLADFSRTVGAKDKQKRKQNNSLIGSAVAGTIAGASGASLSTAFSPTAGRIGANTMWNRFPRREKRLSYLQKNKKDNLNSLQEIWKLEELTRDKRAAQETGKLKEFEKVFKKELSKDVDKTLKSKSYQPTKGSRKLMSLAKKVKIKRGLIGGLVSTGIGVGGYQAYKYFQNRNNKS